MLTVTQRPLCDTWLDPSLSNGLSRVSGMSFAPVTNGQTFFINHPCSVNALSPGYVLTNLTKVILDANPVLRDEWLHRIPMGRMADPSDLKGAIIYLASDSSKYTTGAEIIIDGGYTCL